MTAASSATRILVSGTAVFDGHTATMDQFPPNNPAYTLVLAVPLASPDAAALRQAVRAAAEAAFGPKVPSAIKLPIVEVDGQLQAKFRTKFQPERVDAARQPVAADAEITRGDRIAVVALVSPWEASGSKGVSLRMLAVQQVTAQPRRSAASLFAVQPVAHADPAVAATDDADDAFRFEEGTP